jgi:hypothetical protein
LGREIHYQGQNVVLKLTGPTPFFAFKKQVVMPADTIKNVMVDYFKAPRWMIRMPGTSFSPLNVYEGSFKYADEWYFLSYAGTGPFVTIELEGHHKYSYVIYEVENPTQHAAQIRKQLREWQ